MRAGGSRRALHNRVLSSCGRRGVCRRGEGDVPRPRGRIDARGACRPGHSRYRARVRLVRALRPAWARRRRTWWPKRRTTCLTRSARLRACVLSRTRWRAISPARALVEQAGASWQSVLPGSDFSACAAARDERRYAALTSCPIVASACSIRCRSSVTANRSVRSITACGAASLSMARNARRAACAPRSARRAPFASSTTTTASSA